MARPRRPIRSSMGFHRVVEGALAEERANALGRAGRILDEAIDDHRLLVEQGRASAEQIDASLDAVARAAWNLVVMRECSGFRSNSLAWLRQHYPVPPAALRRI